MAKQFIASHPSELNALSPLPFRRLGTVGRIHLGGVREVHPAREHWETLLNRYYRACGCAEGSAGFLLALLLGGVYAGFKYAQSDWAWGTALLGVLLSLVVGASVGKLLGLMRAHRLLRKTVEEIQGQWNVETPDAT